MVDYLAAVTNKDDLRVGQLVFHTLQFSSKKVVDLPSTASFLDGRGFPKLANSFFSSGLLNL